MKEEMEMTIGQAIKKARGDKRLMRKELAEKSGISLTTIANWENDRNVPTIFLLICLADILDISLDELVGRKQNYERK